MTPKPQEQSPVTRNTGQKTPKKRMPKARRGGKSGGQLFGGTQRDKDKATGNRVQAGSNFTPVNAPNPITLPSNPEILDSWPSKAADGSTKAPRKFPPTAKNTPVKATFRISGGSAPGDVVEAYVPTQRQKSYDEIKNADQDKAPNYSHDQQLVGIYNLLDNIAQSTQKAHTQILDLRTDLRAVDEYTRKIDGLSIKIRSSLQDLEDREHGQENLLGSVRDSLRKVLAEKKQSVHQKSIENSGEERNAAQLNESQAPLAPGQDPRQPRADMFEDDNSFTIPGDSMLLDGEETLDEEATLEKVPAGRPLDEHARQGTLDSTISNGRSRPAVKEAEDSGDSLYRLSEDVMDRPNRHPGVVPSSLRPSPDDFDLATLPAGGGDGLGHEPASSVTGDKRYTRAIEAMEDVQDEFAALPRALDIRLPPSPVVFPDNFINSALFGISRNDEHGTTFAKVSREMQTQQVFLCPEVIKIDPDIHEYAPLPGYNGALTLVDEQDGQGEVGERYPVFRRKPLPSGKHGRPRGLGWEYAGEYKIARRKIVPLEVWHLWSEVRREDIASRMHGSPWGEELLTRKMLDRPNMTEAEIISYFDRKRTPRLRMNWTLLQCTGWNHEHYDALVAALQEWEERQDPGTQRRKPAQFSGSLFITTSSSHSSENSSSESDEVKDGQANAGFNDAISVNSQPSGSPSSTRIIRKLFPDDEDDDEDEEDEEADIHRPGRRPPPTGATHQTEAQEPGPNRTMGKSQSTLKRNREDSLSDLESSSKDHDVLMQMIFGGIPRNENSNQPEKRTTSTGGNAEPAQSTPGAVSTTSATKKKTTKRPRLSGIIDTNAANAKSINTSLEDPIIISPLFKPPSSTKTTTTATPHISSSKRGNDPNLSSPSTRKHPPTSKTTTTSRVSDVHSNTNKPVGNSVLELFGGRLATMSSGGSSEGGRARPPTTTTTTISNPATISTTNPTIALYETGTATASSTATDAAGTAAGSTPATRPPHSLLPPRPVRPVTPVHQTPLSSSSTNNNNHKKNKLAQARGGIKLENDSHYNDVGVDGAGEKNEVTTSSRGRRVKKVDYGILRPEWRFSDNEDSDEDILI
ncbi:hypothetical protein L228DRAFT_98373 [Xylona heveae TC161]|uniref:DUF6697 domain-containing protein n=1 Tax=Xylona heveae (strain CBS 132557 / TC161) TaxID=1328760 RepID=A0A165I7X8_XYLHT|nr:hypothetical protein L228DRAFT_98373 [Xylona heveae TC161]KZF24515.1 hypothetical protein L228DRAFT_98373 [Xylona heveae TC161]